MENLLVKKAKEEWEKIADESLEIEVIKSFIYAYGSELATLRLFKAFHSAKGSRQRATTDGRFVFILERFA